MTYFEALLYGIVQGITEYLPISSSAHLILLPKFLGKPDPGLTFDVFLHLGTLMATLIYFWREWIQVLRSLPAIGNRFGRGEDPLDAITWRPIVVGTLPALVAGALLHKWVETVFRGNEVLMWTLPIGGLALFAADRFAPQRRGTGELTWVDGLKVGLFQCLALVPGVSRSGSTMLGGRLLGFDRLGAAKFSFLLSMPVTAAAIAFSLRKYDELFSSGIGIGPLLTAFASSFLFGCLAIGGLLKLMRRFGYLSFAVYRVALGILIWRVLGV